MGFSQHVPCNSKVKSKCYFSHVITIFVMTIHSALLLYYLCVFVRLDTEKIEAVLCIVCVVHQQFSGLQLPLVYTYNVECTCTHMY